MTQSRIDEIADGVAAVRRRIDAARREAGRVDTVDLVVVTKTFPASDVAILEGLGIRDVAENRDQEARGKRDEIRARGQGDDAVTWHMIGQVQRKKAASVVHWADVVESVDRPELVAALGRAAVGVDRRIEVLVQVALDPVPRPDRGGVAPAGAVDLAAAVVAEPMLELRGVMGVAPFPGDPDEAFARLAEVSRAFQARWPAAGTVSAGMSGDLEQAIRHGATQVRVGGAILGARPAVQ